MSPLNPERREIDRSLDPERGLPPRLYTQPEVYALETERLFRDGWLCVAREDQIPEPGDYVTLDLVDEPLIVVRGRDRAVRVLSRVCRHRSADLLPGRPAMSRGHASGFACPYHAWSYRPDGRLAAAPLMMQAAAEELASCRLPTFHSESWQGWIFVNLSASAPSLRESLQPLDEFLEPYQLEKRVVAEVREFDSPWNWKILVENFMESYHHIRTHRASLEKLLPAKRSYVPDNEGPYSLLIMPSAEDEVGVSSELPTRRLPQPLQNSLVAGVVYPFHLFAVSADVLTWYQLLPDSHAHFKLRVSICVDQEVLEDPRMARAIESQVELTTHVHNEDIEACDAVWSGLRSRTAVSGPLAAQERAISQFSRWWGDSMRDQ